MGGNFYPAVCCVVAENESPQRIHEVKGLDQQLADAAGVTIEGMPQAEYNAVYLPAGEYEGWLCFESAEGKHLFRLIGLEM